MTGDYNRFVVSLLGLSLSEARFKARKRRP
jgi:hypothetical protein